MEDKRSIKLKGPSEPKVESGTSEDAPVDDAAPDRKEVKMAIQQMKAKAITVSITGDAATGYHVSPPQSVKVNGLITFENDTDGKLTIQMASHRIVDGSDIFEVPMGAKSGGHGQTKKKVRSNASLGRHCYAVWCHGGETFAHGTSMPIIIVDPEDETGDADSTTGG